MDNFNIKEAEKLRQKLDKQIQEYYDKQELNKYKSNHVETAVGVSSCSSRGSTLSQMSAAEFMSKIAPCLDDTYKIIYSIYYTRKRPLLQSEIRRKKEKFRRFPWRPPGPAC